MTLYARYIAEREGFSIIENEHGFATFIVSGDTIYLRDLYVVPEKRRSNVATELVDDVCMVGRTYKCKILTGSVSVKAFTATESLKAVLAYGMRVLGIQGELITFEKEL